MLQYVMLYIMLIMLCCNMLIIHYIVPYSTVLRDFTLYDDMLLCYMSLSHLPYCVICTRMCVCVCVLCLCISEPPEAIVATVLQQRAPGVDQRIFSHFSQA